ncbi:hypothetical protein G7043_25035 [Lentzea sp. NEAU-D13]|uniref:Uncharacterized protein n=1 Tax=Lentzea alba TaxID=2714351 RepID=A0A7C9VYI1_9PSEU|nr:hypothetical protein [Lentzea alba]NGY62198.1 hypothetical protein [Lentzea alba]
MTSPRPVASELFVQGDRGVDEGEVGERLRELPSCSPVTAISSACSPTWLP